MVLAATLAFGLCVVSVLMLGRPAVSAGGRVRTAGFDGVGVLAAFVVTVAAATVLGPINGLTLVLALLLHEAGHLVGARIAGQPQVTFRLLPALGALAPVPTDQVPDDRQFFHALMGAGFSVGPVVLALAVWRLTEAQAPDLARFALAFALSLGLVNTVNLLPFRGLDGGHCLALAGHGISPVILPLALASAVAGLAVAAVHSASVWPLAMASAGMLLTLLRPAATPGAARMSDPAARFGLFAYLATFAVHSAAVAMALGAW